MHLNLSLECSKIFVTGLNISYFCDPVVTFLFRTLKIVWNNIIIIKLSCATFGAFGKSSLLIVTSFSIECTGGESCKAKALVNKISISSIQIYGWWTREKSKHFFFDFCSEIPEYFSLVLCCGLQFNF